MPSKKCKKGEILRSKYKTKNGVQVKSTCIKDLGLKGKGPKILPKLMKGTLGKYSTKKSDLSRHRALLKSARETSANTVILKLNAVSILNKRTSPKTHKKMKKDIKYMQTHKNKV
jgi:hypothetical protein